MGGPIRRDDALRAKAVAVASAGQYGAMAVILEGADPRTLSANEIESIFRHAAAAFRMVESGCQQSAALINGILDTTSCGPANHMQQRSFNPDAADQSMAADFRAAKIAETNELRESAEDAATKYARFADTMRKRDPRRMTSEQVKGDFAWIASIFDEMAANCRASRARLDGIIVELERPASGAT